MKKLLYTLSLCIFFSPASAQILKHTKELGLYQSNKHTHFIKDNDILSPKSSQWIDQNTLLINALEGGSTVVYNTDTWIKQPSIKHDFSKPSFLKVSNYSNPVIEQKFFGKPVEMTSSLDKTWISYYRLSWDSQSKHGSAIAQIDNKTKEIEHIIPTGSIPKMVAHNDKYLVSTNWGDNTVGLYELKNSTPFSYHEIVIDKKLAAQQTQGDRDKNCGFCLRGTVFTKDNQYLLVGRMGGGGLAIIDMNKKEHIVTVRQVPLTPRHIILSSDGKTLYLSTSYSGQVAKISVDTLLTKKSQVNLKDWDIINMGGSVRTIALSHDQKYLYATLNQSSQLAVIDVKNFSILEKYKVASYPVGLSVSPDDRYLAITSQGKSGQGGGNHVDIFERQNISQ